MIIIHLLNVAPRAPKGGRISRRSMAAATTKHKICHTALFGGRSNFLEKHFCDYDCAKS